MGLANIGARDAYCCRAKRSIVGVSTTARPRRRSPVILVKQILEKIARIKQTESFSIFFFFLSFFYAPGPGDGKTSCFSPNTLRELSSSSRRYIFADRRRRRSASTLLLSTRAFTSFGVVHATYSFDSQHLYVCIYTSVFLSVYIYTYVCIHIYIRLRHAFSRETDGFALVKLRAK